MTLDEIKALGKVPDGEYENMVLLKYQKQIESFLSSSSFKKWANKPYIPLLDPETFDYENTEPLEAWVLNMPFPKYYDFVAFGSHCAGFHGAIRSFLGLCDTHAASVLREFLFGDEPENVEENSSIKQYISIYLILVAMQKTKQMGYIKHSYLLLTNLTLDLNTQKFYSLIDASKALHVVRDPIEVLRGLVTTAGNIKRLTLENGGFIDFGLFFFHNPHVMLKNHHTYYRDGLENGKEKNTKLAKPTLDSIETWLQDCTQSFHDGILFNLLSESLQDICLKETKDFFPDKVMDTLKEIGAKFGFEVPKDDEWLFKVSGRALKNLLPLTIYVNDKFELYNTGKNKTLATKEDAENSIKILFTSVLDGIEKLYPERDISEYFELQDPLFRIFTTQNGDKEKLIENKSLLNKTQLYIKEVEKAVLEHIEDVKEARKQITEKDVLEYLKTHKKQRELMKTIMAQHLMILKQIAPNIVNSWKYYNEFEALCKELDAE